MIPASTLREGVNVAKDNAGLGGGRPESALAPPSCDDVATLDEVEPLVLYVDEVEEVACPPLSDLRRKFIWNECTRFDSSKGASYP
jgi:hypothetical protein